MLVTEDNKKEFKPETQALLVQKEPVKDLEEARSLLAKSPHPFILFRYRQELGNKKAEKKVRVRTAILYERKDGPPGLIDPPEPREDSMHPVRLILLTLTNLFFPTSESPYPADEVFEVIREALEAEELDRYIFDGGGNQLG